MNFVDIMFNYCQNKGCGVEVNAPLKDYTTFKIGGTCDILLFPKDKETLIEIFGIIKNERADYLILGNGSNVLICENHFRGAVIVTSEMNGFEITDGGLIYAESGVNLTKLTVAAKDHALTGLEFAYGIPGTIGGAVYMNAGAYDSTMSDIVMSSEYINLDTDTFEIETMSSGEHEFSYRESIFSKGNFLILSSLLRLNEGRREDIEELMLKNMNARREKQPLEYPSAGSTFKRCGDYFTSKLIEDCGLKGRKLGGAMVSEKHAGFIINTGRATFDDVISLVEIIKNTVYEKTGANIECEMKIIKF